METSSDRSTRGSLSRKVASILVLLAALGGCGADPGPTYRGRTTSDWAEQLKTGRDRREVNEAIEALVAVGAGASKFVRPLLRHETPGVRSRACVVLGRISPPAVDAVPDLIVALEDPDGNVKGRAAEALKAMGPAAAAAIPALEAAAARSADQMSQFIISDTLKAIRGRGLESR